MKLQELLKSLINSEEYASQIYLGIAEKSKGEIAETAILFAKQEENHSKRIEITLNRLENPNFVVSPEIALIPQTNVLNEKFNTESIEFTTRKKLFLYALQVEKDSIVLYQEIAKLFNEDTREKELFIQLVEEERKHMYYILKKLHELI